jgi:putative addiction module component (TIGR02574 family)
MTTLTVDMHNEQEERVLLAFLNSLKYDYHTNTSDELSEEQKAEILRRHHLYENGKMKTEPWEEVKKRFIKG